MPQHTGYGAAAGYLGMWMAMMVPMMLPSVVPMLARYRRSVRGARAIHLHVLTAMVGAGYFAVWAALGLAAYAAGRGLAALAIRWEEFAEWWPLATGVVLLVAGGLQFSSWKARWLALCRDASACGCSPAQGALGAWRHGLELGARCSLCCGNLMLALLAIGTMDLAAMAAVTVAIAAERLTPAPLPAARVAGATIVAVGVLTLATP